MNHPDFRLHGKIFASLGYPEDGWGMVKLLPEAQQEFIARAPDAFVPCAGAWGRAGSTSVRLAVVPMEMVREAVKAAAASIADRSKTKRPRKRVAGPSRARRVPGR